MYIIEPRPYHLVVSDCLRPPELEPTRLLCPWDFPGKRNGVGCHFLSNIYYIYTHTHTHTPTPASLSIHLLIDAACFHTLALSKMLLWTLVHVSFWICWFFESWFFFFFFFFLIRIHTVFHSGYNDLLHFYQQNIQILTNIYYFYSFWWKPLWKIWGDTPLCFWFAFLWWLAVLSIFSCAWKDDHLPFPKRKRWPFPLWRNVYSGPLSIFFLKYGWYTVPVKVYSEVIQLHLYMYFTDSIIGYYKILNIVPYTI